MSDVWLSPIIGSGTEIDRYRSEMADSLNEAGTAFWRITSYWAGTTMSGQPIGIYALAETLRANDTGLTDIPEPFPTNTMLVARSQQRPSLVGDLSSQDMRRLRDAVLTLNLSPVTIMPNSVTVETVVERLLEMFPVPLERSPEARDAESATVSSSIIDDVIGTGTPTDPYRPSIADDLNLAGSSFWDYSAALPLPGVGGKCMVTARKSTATLETEDPSQQVQDNMLLARSFDDTAVADLPPNAFGQMNAALARNGFPPKGGASPQLGKAVIRETGKNYNANTNADRTRV